MESASRPAALLFDVNETLLDLAALDPLVGELLGDPGLRRTWFAQMLTLALTATVTDRYRPFGEHGAAALEMLGRVRGVELGDDAGERLRAGMVSLPAHADVRPGLERVRAAGYRLAALTNSTQAVGDRQLAHAGLDDLFEHVLSADAVRRLKPAAEPYRHAAERVGAELGDTMLVAAHPWDVAGALAAGARAAFVARPGMVLNPAGEQPELVVADVEALAAALGG